MSITIIGLIVSVVGKLSDSVGITIGTEELTSFINVALQLGGVAIAWFGRWRQGDISVFGGKR